MLLSLAIWIPMLAGVLVLALGERYARWTALVGSILGFLVTLPLYWNFDVSSSTMQFVEFARWIERFNVNYHLGGDGIPMLLMLVALPYLYGKSGGSFAILDWHKLPLPLGAQLLLFFGFLFAFAVKVPMWPVHTWLPDAHTEAPTAGSVVLAAILLKLGAYGFVRFSLPIMPDASRQLAWLMLALSVIAVVYIGFVALAQPDMKRLIAYASISHMGLVTLGFFIFNAYGIEGGLVQMISHGFVSAALFLCVGVLYDRMHRRMIADYGGVANTMPKFASLMMLFAMANSGLPATIGFVGEFLVILGAMKTGFWLAFLAATTMVLGAAYTLWMYKRVMFGAVANPQVAALKDLNGREATVLGLLALAVLGMGVYPFPFTEVMHASVNDLLRHVALPKT